MVCSIDDPNSEEFKIVGCNALYITSKEDDEDIPVSDNWEILITKA